MDLFAGLLDSSLSSYIDPEFLLRLQRGNPAREIGISFGEQILASLGNQKMDSKDYDPNSPLQENQRISLLLAEAYRQNDRLREGLKDAQAKIASYKKDLEQASSRLAVLTRSFENEKQKYELEIRQLSEKIINLNRIVAHQEIQLQNLLGDNQSAYSA
jgi:predicted RNase H-like nuclease (RuvC/YqgF family)